MNSKNCVFMIFSRNAVNVGLMLFVGVLQVLIAAVAQAEITVTTGHNKSGLGFTFKSVPLPADNDAATDAQFSIVDGDRDGNGGDLAVLHNGRVPVNEDQPSENFFFRARADGGRILIDLGKPISVKQVNTFSWHAGTRAPQVYQLYATEDIAGKVELKPKRGTDPATQGWTLVANVDTRPKDQEGGGQYGVGIASNDAVIGKYRYLLFDISRTENRDAFGNTFFSEIDVIDADGPAPTSNIPQPVLQSFETDDHKYHFTIDVTDAPELADWSAKELKAVVLEWYPKIVAMLPSEGYTAPAEVALRYRSDMGNTPASAAGAGINLNTPWFRGQRDREACGAVVHEIVHVVQNYWSSRRDPKAARTPGWIVEGIADYVRWFHYEPQSRGAEITKGILGNAKYDSSYRITANFLNWVSQKYDPELVRKLNAAAREGKYDEQLWKDWTKKTLPELGDEWKAFHTQRINAEPN